MSMVKNFLCVSVSDRYSRFGAVGSPFFHFDSFRSAIKNFDFTQSRQWMSLVTTSFSDELLSARCQIWPQQLISSFTMWFKRTWKKRRADSNQWISVEMMSNSGNWVISCPILLSFSMRLCSGSRACVTTWRLSSNFIADMRFSGCGGFLFVFVLMYLFSLHFCFVFSFHFLFFHIRCYYYLTLRLHSAIE